MKYDTTATRCNCLGSIHIYNYDQSNRVYDPLYISPTIPCYHTDGEVKILIKEVKPAAIRGRDSVEIKHGFNEYREPEIKDDGCCNTISTVQKDNMIVEPCIIQRVGDMDKENYSVHGDYVNCIPSNPMSDREQVVCIKQATSKGYIECENGGGS